jgi:hypothetical protein
MILEVGTSRDANLSVVCSAPATTAAGSNQERMPSKSGDHDKVLLVVQSLVIAGIEIDPALGRPGSERRRRLKSQSGILGVLLLP